MVRRVNAHAAATPPPVDSSMVPVAIRRLFARADVHC